ncbi:MULTISPECIES: CPBP family intramembrane glutamic endopeptidase [Parabacteroides]|uniref:CPBP family intramembrane glutamic endopeptidase n=1 Tax=Parabacteroides TaxID=375288 RepID=UPI000F0080D4|nr:MULTISPECIES: CPBP family intramembrane glutamic endopeptidase [Parabacteroides]RHU21828.1 CPBP family intramembrane metalloprotease [Parabacteroides sp. TM07-1AC]WFE85388.1 CPBP family intramembrane metalloprotease [Parabacteroides chongii]
MMLKGIYAGKPALFQLLLLLVSLLLGAIFSSLIGTGIFFMLHGTAGNIMHYPGMMRMMQLISAIGTFLFPALAVAWLCSPDPEAYLCIKRKTDTKILLLVLASMILMSPTITLTALLNKQMVLPSFMAPVEAWMQTQEALAEQLTNTLLAGDGLLTFLSNLVVMALMAGITEEFLFRGALQRIIGQWTANHHIVIWSAAILFSAFHLQFYGFLPRMLLGAYFGYLLYWSRNIWIPVFAHFANNAFAVIGMSDNRLKENEFITGDISNANLLPYSALAVITLLLFIVCVQRIRKTIQ